MAMLTISRLQTRFVLLLHIGALLFSLLAGAIAYQLAFQRALAQSEEAIERLCLTVKTTAAIAAYVDNRDVAKDVVTGLLNNEIVQSARIESSSGGTMIEQRKPEGEAIGAAFAVRCPLYSPFDAREQVGNLIIKPNQRLITGNARTEATIQVVILVAQVALTSLLSMVLVSVLLSRPIGQLAASLRGLTPGSSQRLPVPPRHRRDEIGVLIRSSNELLEATESAFREERRLRAEMEEMERQYRRIFDTTSAGILVLNGDGRLINANPTLMKMIGRDAHAHRASDGLAFLNEVFVHPEQALELVRRSLEQRRVVAQDLELHQGGGNTGWVHGLISVHAVGEQIELIEAVLYDITDRKRKESEVRHLAEHDVLTGLKNRHSSERFIENALREAAQNGSSVAVMLIDLDSFKPVNDMLGHAAGDEVLVAVAAQLRGIVRSSSDLAGRLGGDEFVLVVCDPTVDVAGISRVAEQLLHLIGQPLSLANGSTVALGASIGIACYPAAGATCAELIRAADAAMYRVKCSGKNGFAFAEGAALADH